MESSGLKEYAAWFSENGYDDLNLIKILDDDEIKEMIKNLKIEKPGHVLRLKKCITVLNNTVLIENFENQKEQPTNVIYKTKSSE